MRPGGPERESHDMLHIGTGVLVSQDMSSMRQRGPERECHDIQDMSSMRPGGPERECHDIQDMSSMRPGGPERECHDMLHNGTGVLVSQANAPTEQGIGIYEEHPGEVQRVSHGLRVTEKGATSEFSYMVQGSDGTVDQFLANGRKAKDHMVMWPDEFLEEGDDYFSSMSSFMTNQFNPEFQFMSGLQNPTVGAPSLSSSSSLPYVVQKACEPKARKPRHAAF